LQAASFSTELVDIKTSPGSISVYPQFEYPIHPTIAMDDKEQHMDDREQSIYGKADGNEHSSSVSFSNPTTFLNASQGEEIEVEARLLYCEYVPGTCH
jgi:hypothetical protein